MPSFQNEQRQTRKVDIQLTCQGLLTEPHDHVSITNSTTHVIARRQHGAGLPWLSDLQISSCMLFLCIRRISFWHCCAPLRKRWSVWPLRPCDNAESQGETLPDRTDTFRPHLRRRWRVFCHKALNFVSPCPRRRSTVTTKSGTGFPKFVSDSAARRLLQSGCVGSVCEKHHIREFVHRIWNPLEDMGAVASPLKTTD